MLSDRFKSMYRQMGLDRPAAAKLLHVSERTLHNWETGVHEIPYSAYKLLRLLGHTELPGAWSGWHIAAGQLWSPEGHGFKPADSSWWSALCRRAALFHELVRENEQLKQRLQSVDATTTECDGKRSAADSGDDAAQRFGVKLPVTLHLSPKSGIFPAKKHTALVAPGCPARVRYNLPKALFASTVKGGQA
nr:VC1465 family Xer recombination activation factor [uncultured Rhodoferax sp.]